MTILGLIGRRVGSAPAALVAARARLAGASSLLRSAPTGLLFAGATDGVLPHSPPTTALYRGAPPSVPFGIIASGSSSLAAGGGGAIGVPCLPGTGALAVGGKVHGLTSAGGATSANSRACIGGAGGPTRLRPPTSGGLLPFSPLGNGMMPSSGRAAAAAKGVREYYNTSTQGDDSKFSTLWSVQKMVMDCKDGIVELNAAASSNHAEIVKMLESVFSRLDTITALLSSIQKGARLRTVVLRSIVGVVVGYGTLILLALGTCLYLDMPYDQPKANFINAITTLIHEVLKNPDVQKHAATYAAIFSSAFRGAMFSLKNPIVISKNEFAEQVTKVAHSAMSILSSDGRCKEVTLIKKLKLVGHGDAVVNLQVLRFLSTHGYLKRETETSKAMGVKFSTVYYSCTTEAQKLCESGEMKTRISKVVKESASLEEMLRASGDVLRA